MTTKEPLREFYDEEIYMKGELEFDQLDSKELKELQNSISFARWRLRKASEVIAHEIKIIMSKLPTLFKSKI